MKVSQDELLKAIERHGGCVNQIAREYKMTSNGLRKRLRENPELAEAVQEARETLIDEAEAGLRKAVKQQKPWALKLVLTTIGAKRGYGHRLQVESDMRARIIIKLPDNGRRLTPLSPSGLIEYEQPQGGAVVHSEIEPSAITQELLVTMDEPSQSTTRANSETNEGNPE